VANNAGDHRRRECFPDDGSVESQEQFVAMTWIFALLGLAMAVAGGVAVATGWPLVPLERGWTMVIAGSAAGSAGVICLVLAKLVWEARRMRLAIEHALGMLSAARTDEPAPASGPSADTAGQTPTYGATAVGDPGEPTSLTPPHEGPVIASDELEASRSFTVGTTTFVVFIDGSIEAHTPAGVRRFASMREVRTYLDDGRADKAP
jgi:hypothetical protein